MEEPYDLRLGDSRDVLKTLADASVDSVVCDPPYALVSIVKRFGGANAAPAKDGVYGRASAGFMGQQWDNGETAFDPEFWAEVLRVLKPGGHLLAFSGTRTYHHMAVAIEAAGLEIRDMIEWMYGSGFPKSHNAGDGRGTALKPAHEPICMARKPLIGTVAENIQAHGTGALHIDGCRVETGDGLGGGRLTGATLVGDGWDRPWMHDEARRDADAATMADKVAKAESLGRWPANLIHDGSDEVVALFPAEAGASAPVRGTEASAVTDGIYGERGRVPGAFHADGGSAARFFYCAKASATDRSEGLPEGKNAHPTVKPTNLMRYLCRLVTPPGGVVLDPFMGSGSTGKAAMLEGFQFIGIEREAGYMEIARARVAFGRRAALLPKSSRPKAKPKLPTPGQSDLFAAE